MKNRELTPFANGAWKNADRSREMGQVDAWVRLHDSLQWYGALPRRLKMIYLYLKAKRRMQTWKMPRKTVLNAEMLTEKDYLDGEFLEDVRDYRYRCDCLDLPMAEPSCVLTSYLFT